MLDAPETLTRPTATVKHTVLWTPDDWEQTRAAAAALSALTGVRVTVPAFIKGAVLRRATEVLSPPTSAPSSDQAS